MNKYLISIVVPAYNIENYLANTLDSILNQTYSNIEIIVVDDGSKDKTPDIIDDYAKKDARIRAIHKENGGVTSARLKGILAATSDYIGFVDGDDYIEPDMFERLINNALKHNADISHCGYQMVFPSRVDYYYNTGKVVVQDNSTGIHDLLKGEFVEPGLWNKLYHRDLFYKLLKNNLITSDIKINEDLLMNHYLFRESKTSVFEDFCPYHYMIREGSAATSAINEYKLKDPLKVWETIKEDIVSMNNAALSALVEEKIIRRMIAVSVLSLKPAKDLIKPYRAEVRRDLRKKLKVAKNISRSLKLMGIWAAYLPTSYRLVHNIYLKITGLDKIYEIS